MDFDTGSRLKAEREKRRLSQRQLAAVTGVTGSMISMIEQNRTSPSIATLKKILAGLD
ncbi:MAG: helix-turn-helix transcriptional regulator, partial [Albidovulum sp.]